jgi:hypothetical protein
MEARLDRTLTVLARAALHIAIVVLILDHGSVANSNPSYSDSSAPGAYTSGCCNALLPKPIKMTDSSSTNQSWISANEHKLTYKGLEGTLIGSDYLHLHGPMRGHLGCCDWQMGTKTSIRNPLQIHSYWVACARSLSYQPLCLLTKITHPGSFFRLLIPCSFCHHEPVVPSLSCADA